MKKSIVQSFNYLENSINDDLMNSPPFLNNVNNFNFCQNDIFIQKNNQINDYDEENEEENEYPCIIADYCITNYNESKFVNIFSFENGLKETITNKYIENDNNEEDDFSKKIREMLNFSGHNNDKESNDGLNSLNFNNYFLIDNKNKINNSNNSNNSNLDMLGEPVIEVKVSDEICVDSNIINEKTKKTIIRWQKLETNYGKKFQLFNKTTNNPYINEIINFINNISKIRKKRMKKIFKTYNIENGNNAKLIGRKRKNEPKKRCEKPDDIRKKLKSRFHKIFTKKLNDNLKKINSKKKFYSLPQIFITNIAKKQNKEVMNMKLKDLFRKNFVEDYKKYKLKFVEANNGKYLKNLNTLEYLEKNIDIQEKSNFNIIGEMKYFEILEEFFYSEEFEDTVIAESKNKSFEYVKDYVFKARTYVKFFLSGD